MRRRQAFFSAPLTPLERSQSITSAILFSGFVTLAALPMLVYHFQYLSGHFFSHPPDIPQVYRLAVKQSVLLFLPVMLCSLIGFIYAPRLRLPGFGVLRDMLFWLPAGLLAGALFSPLAYLVLDRHAMQILPALYPLSANEALAEMLGIALTQETLVRFGLLTIAVYLFDRNRNGRYLHYALVVIACFGSAGMYMFLQRVGLYPLLSPWQAGISLVMAFALQWFYCRIFLRYGLLAAICLHFGLNLKYLIYAVTGANA